MKFKLLLCSYLCFQLAIGHTQSTIRLTSGSAGCFNNTTLTSTTSDGGSPNRKIYTGTAANGATQIQVQWEINKWVIRIVGGNDIYNNTSTSAPNAPTTGWTDGTVNCGALTSAVLPIELTQFAAKAASQKIILSWSTASEKNNQGFDIERSLDGTDFQKIGFVKGNGTTNITQQYTYTDDAVLSAVTYYRLKQVDTDGKFQYSKVVSVESKGDGLKVYPTLVSDGLLTVQGAQSDDFSVANVFGQTVLIGKTAQQVDVSTLAKGSYLLKIGSEVTKFVKQ